eukprot:2100526-Rhodomonas_salina.1
MPSTDPAHNARTLPCLVLANFMEMQCICACYAMSGTYLAYGGAVCALKCCATSGTDVAHDATSVVQHCLRREPSFNGPGQLPLRCYAMPL